MDVLFVSLTSFAQIQSRAETQRERKSSKFIKELDQLRVSTQRDKGSMPPRYNDKARGVAPPEKSSQVSEDGLPPMSSRKRKRFEQFLVGNVRL